MIYVPTEHDPTICKYCWELLRQAQIESTKSPITITKVIVQEREPDLHDSATCPMCLARQRQIVSVKRSPWVIAIGIIIITIIIAIAILTSYTNNALQ